MDLKDRTRAFNDYKRSAIRFDVAETALFDMAKTDPVVREFILASEDERRSAEFFNSLCKRENDKRNYHFFERAVDLMNITPDEER